MKLANVSGRAVLVKEDGVGIDVAEASDGVHGPSLMSVFDQWEAFRSWADRLGDIESTVTFSTTDLQAPSPVPRQIFAIGLNYRAHAAESGFEEPDSLPPTFTKFASSLAGADTTVTLPPNGQTDWEVELVVVIGVETHRISRDQAWDHVAGLSVGQDISERTVQLRGPAPQFSLGKSFPGFAPVGPWLVTTDELTNSDELQLTAAINGEVVQSGNTRDLIFPVASLISELSHVVRLYPGDLVFTGTPAGVGVGRHPQRFLQSGEELVSTIDGIGTIRQRFVD